MVIRGPDALKSIDSAIYDIRAEEKDIASRLKHSDAAISKYLETEAGLFQKLAKLRLTPHMQRQLGDKLSSAEKSARRVLEAHAKEQADIQKDIDSADAEMAKLALQRQEMLDESNKHSDALADLSDEIAAKITQNPEFAQKRADADEARAIAEESLKKTQTAEADKETKGRPYREDPLFMYLWDNGFGTRNYQANNLVRYLDSLVARLINFKDARPNFAMLNEIPLRLREHAERQMEAAEDADAALDEIEAQAVEEAGGGDLKNQLEELRAKIDKIDQNMVKVEDNRHELTRKFAEIADEDNPALEVAVRGLAGSFQAGEFAQLVAEARRTPSHEDDAILAQIDDLRLRVVDEESETKELKSRLRTLARRRRELEEIEFEFKKSHFDDPRSSFKNDDLVGDLLGEFLRGAVSASSYWDKWQRSQDWRADVSNWGGGIGLPKGGRKRSSRRSWGSPSTARSSGKSSFSRPKSGSSKSSRKGSRGSRRHGGFRTGGGA